MLDTRMNNLTTKSFKCIVISKLNIMLSYCSIILLNLIFIIDPSIYLAIHPSIIHNLNRSALFTLFCRTTARFYAGVSMKSEHKLSHAYSPSFRPVSRTKRNEPLCNTKNTNVTFKMILAFAANYIETNH